MACVTVCNICVYLFTDCTDSTQSSVCRGIGMGVVFQLSTASCCKEYINVRGFAFGAGKYNTLLGFNVIGTIVAWGLAGLTLLENSEGSNLIIAAAQGNNVIKVIQKLLRPLDRALGGKFDKDTDDVGQLGGDLKPVATDHIDRVQQTDMGRSVTNPEMRV